MKSSQNIQMIAEEVCEYFNKDKSQVLATYIQTPYFQGVKLIYLSGTRPPVIPKEIVDKGVCILIAAADRDQFDFALWKHELKRAPCAPASFFSKPGKPQDPKPSTSSSSKKLTISQ